MARSRTWLLADGVTAASPFSEDFGQVAAGDSDAVKRWLKNDGDVAIVSEEVRLIDATGNGAVGVHQAAIDTATVRPPHGGAGVQGGAGGTFGAAVTWYFKVTRTNGAGETQPSVQFSYLITDTAKKIDLSWALPSGGAAGTGVKVYASTTSEVYGASSLIATLGAAVTTFSWDGTAPTSGSPPASNTTGGAAPDYGTPPALGTATLVLGSFPVGAMIPLWAGPQVATGAADGSYQMNLRPVGV